MRRHRFEPAKLVAGLVLLVAAALALVDATDDRRLPDWLPLAVVPSGLAAAALVAAVTYAARRARRRAAEAGCAPEPELSTLPMDELRQTYDARFGGGTAPAGKPRPGDDDGAAGEPGPR